MVAEAVGLLPGAGDEVICRTRDAAGAYRQLVETEAADVDTRTEGIRVVPGRHHEVDRAAQRVGAIAQGVGALVDLDIAVDRRVDLLEVAVAVGGVEGNAVHEQVDRAQVEVARQARAANGQARVIAPLRLHEHARNIIEHVLDRARRRRCLVGRVRDQLDATRCLLNLGPCLGRVRDGQAPRPRRGANALRARRAYGLRSCSRLARLGPCGLLAGLWLGRCSALLDDDRRQRRR